MPTFINSYKTHTNSFTLAQIKEALFNLLAQMKKKHTIEITRCICHRTVTVAPTFCRCPIRGDNYWWHTLCGHMRRYQAARSGGDPAKTHYLLSPRILSIPHKCTTQSYTISITWSCRYWPKCGSMLGQRLRRWPSIEPQLGHHSVYPGMVSLIHVDPVLTSSGEI